MLEFMPRMPDWTEYFLKMKRWSNANWIVTANLPRNSFIPIKNYHRHHSKHKTGNKQTKTHSSRKAMTTVKACDRVQLSLPHQDEKEGTVWETPALHSGSQSHTASWQLPNNWQQDGSVGKGSYCLGTWVLFPGPAPTQWKDRTSYVVLTSIPQANTQ